MSGLVERSTDIPAMTQMQIDNVRQLEQFSLRQLPQVNIDTMHVLHAGMYARTITIPAGVVLTGALIEVATLIVVYGEVTVCVGEKDMLLRGFNVIPASANRKQAFIAKTDTHLTMVFPTSAKTIIEAETEFTNEAHMLISRRENAVNTVIITGE